MVERRFDAPEPDDLRKIKEQAGDQEPRAVERSRVRSRKAALELKKLGADFDDIAKVLEFDSPGAARQAVEQAIIDAGEFSGDKENIRALMGLQLDQWHKSIAQKIIDQRNTQQLEYMAMGLRLMERKARLFGVDAPTKIEMHAASNEEISELINAYRSRLALEVPEEGDPFELVEGDDGVWSQPEDMGITDDDE